MDGPKVSHYHPLKPRNCGAILATKELPFFTEVELRFALKDLLFTKWKTEIQNKIVCFQALVSVLLEIENGCNISFAKK